MKKSQNQGSDNASIGSQGSQSGNEDLGELVCKVSYSTSAKKLTVEVVEIEEGEFLTHPEHRTMYINASLPDHKQKVMLPFPYVSFPCCNSNLPSL